MSSARLPEAVVMIAYLAWLCSCPIVVLFEQLFFEIEYLYSDKKSKQFINHDLVVFDSS